MPAAVPDPPAADPDGTAIRWEPYTSALQLTHVDPSCDACPYPGPLLTSAGKTLHRPAPEPHRRRRRAPAAAAAYWCVTHWAVLCPRCHHLVAYRTGTWVVIAERQPRLGAVLPPAENTLF